MLLATYRQSPFDLAIYDQSIWLLSRGQTFNTVAGINVFGAHMSPILFGLIPLSWFGNGPVPELIFQGFWVALGVFPAYLLGKTVRKGRLFALLYLLHPAIASGIAFGFRPWNLAIPVMMLFAFQVATQKQTAGIALVAIFLSLFREDMMLWIALMLVVGWRTGRLRLSSAAAIAAIPGFWAIAAVTVLLPQLSPTNGYLYQTTLQPTSPNLDLIQTVASLAVLVVYVTIPFGLAVIWQNRTLALGAAAIPLVGLALKGGNALTPYFHYEMPFVPLILLIISTGVATRLNGRLVTIGLLTISLLFGPFRVPGITRWPGPLEIDRNTLEISQKLGATVSQYLSSGESAALPVPLVAHFAERSQITIFPYPFDSVAREPYPMECPFPYLVVVPPERTWETPIWDAAATQYTGAFAIEGFRGYVLARTPSTESCIPLERR